MKKQTAAFRAVDILLLAMIILPLVCGMVLKVLYTPASEGVNISGALIYLTVDFPIQPLIITESQINSWLIIISIFGLILYMTHGLDKKATLKRQLAVEWAVEKCQGLVDANMGGMFSGYAPFIAAIMALSVFSSLSCLAGLRSPTADVNVTTGWAVLVFAIITRYKLKGGLLYYLKGFTEPIPVFTPINCISEFSTPVSMAFRHYGNVLSGAVISTLLGTALSGLSKTLLGWLPAPLSQIPILQIGLPAIFSVYFDIFSGCMQAFIFATLTMLNIANNFPEEQWRKRQEKKQARKERELSQKAA